MRLTRSPIIPLLPFGQSSAHSSVPFSLHRSRRARPRTAAARRGHPGGTLRRVPGRGRARTTFAHARSRAGHRPHLSRGPSRADASLTAPSPPLPGPTLRSTPRPRVPLPVSRPFRRPSAPWTRSCPLRRAIRERAIPALQPSTTSASHSPRLPLSPSGAGAGSSRGAIARLVHIRAFARATPCPTAWPPRFFPGARGSPWAAYSPGYDLPASRPAT